MKCCGNIISVLRNDLFGIATRTRWSSLLRFGLVQTFLHNSGIQNEPDEHFESFKKIK